MLPDINRAIEHEIKNGFQVYRTELTCLRAEIAELKRQDRMHEREISALKQTLAELIPAAMRPEKKKQIRRFNADTILRVREELGLTAIELATLLSVSNVTVSRWENGMRKPRLKIQKSLAELRTLGKRKVRKLLAEKTGV